MRPGSRSRTSLLLHNNHSFTRLLLLNNNNSLLRRTTYAVRDIELPPELCLRHLTQTLINNRNTFWLQLQVICDLSRLYLVVVRLPCLLIFLLGSFCINSSQFTKLRKLVLVNK